ncbi:MAG: hypothetical protein JW881_21090 [Spirochaetales bacterium]|nr:hypothetical protein [Spirochaetales bacterium]
MTENTASNIKPIAIATAAVLVLYGVLEQTGIDTSSVFNFPDIEDEPFANKINLENINDPERSLLNKIEIINKFINKLTNDSKDLDSRIVSLVNDNFWDLM